MANYDQWKAKNPEMAANLEAAFDIASIVPVGKAGKLAAEGIEQGARLSSKAIQGVRKGIDAVDATPL